MKQKRILIISTYFPPLPSAASLRVYSFAKYWARMGNDVTVLTTNKTKQSDSDFNLPHELFKVVEIPYFSVTHEAYKVLKRLRAGILNRTINNPGTDCASINTFNVSLKLKSIINKLKRRYGFFTTARIPDDHDTWIWPAVNEGDKLLNTNKFDWIFSSYGPPASHIVAGILSKRHKIRWIADYRDLWIEGHIYPGIWPFKMLEKHLENKYVGNYANILTTVSLPLAKILGNKFSTQVHVIQNGYDEEDYVKAPPPYFKHEKKTSAAGSRAFLEELSGGGPGRVETERQDHAGQDDLFCQEDERTLPRSGAALGSCQVGRGGTLPGAIRRPLDHNRRGTEKAGVVSSAPGAGRSGSREKRSLSHPGVRLSIACQASVRKPGRPDCLCNCDSGGLTVGHIPFLLGFSELYQKTA